VGIVSSTFDENEKVIKMNNYYVKNKDMLNVGKPHKTVVKEIRD